MVIDISGMITVAEAAKRLHLSHEQMRRNLRDGKLRGQRIGNQWFVEELALEKSSHTSYLPPELIARIKERRSGAAFRALPPAVQMIEETRESNSRL